MPIIKSAIKRARQQEKRRSHNLQVKRAVHSEVRALAEAIAAKKPATEVAEALSRAQSQIDRAVKKHTLHQNTAGRQKSQLFAQAAPLLKDYKPTPKVKSATKKTTKPAAKAATAAAKAAPAKKPAATKKPATKTTTKAKATTKKSTK